MWDTGPGISESHQKSIFEEFGQIENPERDRSRGLGLGLAIVRRLAHILNVPLTLQSRPGKGSVFKVSVELAAESAGAPASGCRCGGDPVVSKTSAHYSCHRR